MITKNMKRKRYLIIMRVTERVHENVGNRILTLISTLIFQPDLVMALHG